jgi:hypothetical protein
MRKSIKLTVKIVISLIFSLSVHSLITTTTLADTVAQGWCEIKVINNHGWNGEKLSQCIK